LVGAVFLETAVTEAEKMELIKEAIRELEAALSRLVVKIGPPIYIVEADKPRFRYTTLTRSN